jgi:hypothetical protein
MDVIVQDCGCVSPGRRSGGSLSPAEQLISFLSVDEVKLAAKLKESLEDVGLSMKENATISFRPVKSLVECRIEVRQTGWDPIVTKCLKAEGRLASLQHAVAGIIRQLGLYILGKMLERGEGG